MNPKSVREKGKNFERELATEIERRLGGRAWRTPCSGSQWWNRADVTSRDNIMSRFHIEAKRQEKFSLETWYNQALRGAQGGQIPLVAARRSRDKAMVYMTFDDFLTILELWQKCEGDLDELDAKL